MLFTLSLFQVFFFSPKVPSKRFIFEPEWPCILIESASTVTKLILVIQLSFKQVFESYRVRSSSKKFFLKQLYTLARTRNWLITRVNSTLTQCVSLCVWAHTTAHTYNYSSLGEKSDFSHQLKLCIFTIVVIMVALKLIF